MLRMLSYGMAAGLAFLLAVALLERLAASRNVHASAVPGPDVSEQVWQVLAEARKITEESA